MLAVVWWSQNWVWCLSLGEGCFKQIGLSTFHSAPVLLHPINDSREIAEVTEDILYHSDDDNFSTTFLKIVVGVKASRPPHVLRLWLEVIKDCGWR